MEVSRESAGKVYEEGVRSGWKDTEVYGERGREEGEVEDKDGEEGDGV